MASGTTKNLPFTRLDLLWTNPSSESNFAAQDVSVDLDGYDLVALVIKYSEVSYASRPPLMFYRIVDERNCYMPLMNNTNNYTGGRSFSYSVANKVISFTKAEYNGATDNAYLIPFEIYGVKL